MNTSWVDTSLDLNPSSARPLRLETPKKEQPNGNLIVFGKRLSAKEETGALAEELSRVNAENKKLTEMLSAMCESYNALQSQVMDLMSKNPEKELSPSKKRKSENNNDNNYNNFGIVGNSESSSTDEDSCKKPREEVIKAKVTRVYVRTETSDGLIVKDGYQWRKYGQKVTRDNPSPRAYFRCSFAPSCPVKKKVQRSADDQSVMVATYEGEHNHLPPSQTEPASGSSHGSASLNPSGPTMSLGLTKSKPSDGGEARNSSSGKPEMDSPQVRKYLVEQMATSLTKDPNFTAALAAAISGRMFSAKSN
ncbi:hypothetical protein V6N13_011099 [Hibiscus sabdariffa]